MNPCPPCICGWHFECYEANYDEGSCCCNGLVDELIETTEVKRGGPTKPDELVTDVTSTGRKRAAVMYPIEEGMICEWANLRFAGGGIKPIIGCEGRPASARHHGPDKDTLNNNPGNVHRICVFCHVRWHTRNDEFYGKRPSPGNSYLPSTGDYKIHDPNTKATELEVAKNEIYWLANKTTKVGADDE
jgi:hypothetical protein